MGGCTDTAVDGPRDDRIVRAHFEDVDLAATRPIDLTNVVAQQPECRPQSVRKVGHFDTRHQRTVLECHAPVRRQPGGCELLAQVAFIEGIPFES